MIVVLLGKELLIKFNYILYFGDGSLVLNQFFIDFFVFDYIFVVYGFYNMNIIVVNEVQVFFLERIVEF